MNKQLETALEYLQNRKPFVCDRYIIGVTDDGTSSLYQVSSGKLIGTRYKNSPAYLLAEIAEQEDVETKYYNDAWSEIVEPEIITYRIVACCDSWSDMFDHGFLTEKAAEKEIKEIQAGRRSFDWEEFAANNGVMWVEPDNN